MVAPRIAWTLDQAGVEFDFAFSKHAYGQSARPTVGDDELDGFNSSSHWHITSGIYANEIHDCQDPATGAAVWTLRGAGAGGITSLNALTDASQTFAEADDTNVTLGIVSAAGVHTFTLGWAGTLADGRIASAATWNAKEPAITATTAADYYRGDKTFQPLTKAAVGLGNADNTADLSKPVSTAQQAAIDAAVVGLWDPKGTIDCSANPNYPAALKGDTYVVSVAGKIGGASGIDVVIGDTLFAIVDNAGGTQAAVGTSWNIIPANFPNVTTVGSGLIALPNPSAIRFLQINADNSVSALSDSAFRTAIGAGTGGGDVVGPASATDGNIALYDGATGKLIKNSAFSPASFQVAGSYQPLDATLTAFAAVTIAANSVTLGTGADAFSQITLAANTFLARSSSGNAAAKTITDFGLALVALASIAQGDVIYASSATAAARLAKDANATRYLSNQGTSNNPSWNQVNLANGVTGVLPTANIADAAVTAVKLGALNAFTDADPALADVLPGYDTSAAANRDFRLDYIGGLVNPSICQGRLTLQSTIPISDTDQTAKTTVYFTPYAGNRIALFDGTRWVLFSFTEKSLALGTVVAGSVYDVFIYDNAGTLTLEKYVWSSISARGFGIDEQDGVKVKNGATTRRYLGTFVATSTTTTEDSKAKRLLWNYYNRVNRHLFKATNAGHAYATAAWRAWNAGAGERVEFCVGWKEDAIMLSLFSQHWGAAYVSIGINTTTGASAAMPQMYQAGGAATQTAAGTTGIEWETHTIGSNYASAVQFGSATATFSDFNISGIVRC